MALQLGHPLLEAARRKRRRKNAIVGSLGSLGVLGVLFFVSMFLPTPKSTEQRPAEQAKSTERPAEQAKSTERPAEQATVEEDRGAGYATRGMAERIIHENFEKTDCPSVAVSELGRSDKGTWTMAYCSNGQRFAIISVYPPIALRCTQRTVDVC